MTPNPFHPGLRQVFPSVWAPLPCSNLRGKFMRPRSVRVSLLWCLSFSCCQALPGRAALIVPLGIRERTCGFLKPLA